jgi:hypothetical protein
MDVAAHGVGAENSIAVACRGSNRDGSCTFDELMRYIDRPTAKPDKDGKKKKNTPKTTWLDSTDIGGDFFPDPVHAAAELSDKEYPSNYDESRLFPNIWTPDDKKPQLSPIIEAITNRIQAARRTLGDGAIALQLEKAKDAINICMEARLADNANRRIKYLNDKLGKLGVTWVRHRILTLLRLYVNRPAGS